jgi:hypothetical protein
VRGIGRVVRGEGPGEEIPKLTPGSEGSYQGMPSAAPRGVE